MFVCFRIIIVTFIAILGTSYGQKPCSTTSPTQCISLTKCTPLLSLVGQSGNLKANELESLRNSLCGFDGSSPKVCCPIVSPEATAQSVAESGVVPDPPDVTKHANLRMINGENCGQISEERIIQGNRSRVLQYPWMALIAYNITGQIKPLFACGGTLISKRYVLTAAHCVSELGSRTKVSGVRLGEHDLGSEFDCDDDASGQKICAEKFQEFGIEGLHVHPQYSKTEHRNDIALIRIDGDADFRPDNVRPICLPVGEAVAIKAKRGTVTGWGLTEQGIRSQVLLRVNLEIVPNDECDKIYSAKHNVSVTYSQLCAGGKDRRDSCTGDSGGPFQSPGTIGGFPRYVQYGIISFGTANCGVVGYPGVYVRVAYYMDWILDTITE